MRTIYMNQDNHHFWGFHPDEDMSVEGLNRLVDRYVDDTQVAAILFCVNVQRALFDSDAWENFYSDYDPDLGEDQPCLRRTHGVKNLICLHERGINQYDVWLSRCREKGVEGWLTMRMNDCHGLKEFVTHYEGAPGWTLEWAGTFWRENPQLRRAPYRLERSWEGAFDYAKPEVRAHHLSLLRELFARYDFDGLEMDWMRWGMMFAPGGEAAGRKILTDFIREVRALADQAEARVGHPIQLAHRVPASPDSALALGYDVIEWAKHGLVDVLTLSSFLGGANFDYPIAIWRQLVGERVKILAHAEEVVCPYPEQSMLSYDAVYGSSASALQRGADGIYFFNQCYRESDAPELLKHLLQNCGELETLKQCPRRHMVTYPQVAGPGEARRTVMPIPLRHPKMGADFGRMEDNVYLRLSIGPKPTRGRALLRLGFGQGADRELALSASVRVNTNSIFRSADYDCNHVCFSIATPNETTLALGQPASVEVIGCWEIPLAFLQDDVNIVEYLAPQIDGTIEWAEILLIP